MGITLGKLITESTTKIFMDRRFKHYTNKNVYEDIFEEMKNEK
jgi:hypothetical protein